MTFLATIFAFIFVAPFIGLTMIGDSNPKVHTAGVVIAVVGLIVFTILGAL